MQIHGLRLDQKTDKKGLKSAQSKLAHPKPFVCGITLNIVMLPPNSVRSYILKTVQNNIKQSLNIVMLPPNVAIIYSDDEMCANGTGMPLEWTVLPRVKTWQNEGCGVKNHALVHKQSAVACDLYVGLL